MVSLKEVAKNIDSPESFTAKILQNLSKNGIVDATKGAKGGYAVPPSKAKELRVVEVVKSLDGDKVYEGCALGLSACDDTNPCPLHHKFTHVKSQLKTVLEETSISEMSEKMILSDSILRF